MISRGLKRLVVSAGATLAAAVAPALALAATPPADDIRDIRPLISIPPWWYWLAAGAAGALIVALLFLGIRYWRRRRERSLTAEQRALQALERADALAHAGQCHEWADLLAQTLRTALAARLGRASCPETTRELAEVDWSKLPLGITVDGPRLVELLSTCDLTRFALGRLEPSALLAETSAARQWVTRLFATPETSTRTKPQATSIEATP